MVFDPRSESEIYDDIKSRLTSSIDRLTNFIDSGFNDAWLSAYSEQLHHAEVKLLAAELAGFVDTAGKSDFDEDSLDQLGVTGVDPADLNELMDDSQLDSLAKIVGVERDPGKPATGTVTFEVSTDSVSIPEGYEVGTEPDDSGDFQSYLVDADSDGTIDEDSDATVTPDAGASTVDADVIAADVGDEYNVGANTVTFVPNPKPGIEGVSNGAELTGGADVQSNPDFREEIKQAVFSSSGGGTAAGVKGYIEDNASSSISVELDEFVGETPPTVDVIVDGGSDSEITSLIEDARPVGIEHLLVRPEVAGLDVRAELVGKDVDTDYVQSEITEYLTGLALDGEYRRSKVIQRTLNADADIDDIGSLTSLLADIGNESSEYDPNTNVYSLDYSPLGEIQEENRLFDSDSSIYETAYPRVSGSTMEVEAVVDGVRTTLTRGTDYSVIDDDGDGEDDAINFGIGGTNPDNRTVFTAGFEHEDWSINSTITDEDGNSFSKGTDWDLVDNDGDGLYDSVDWSVGGSAPASGSLFFVDYSPKRDVTRDLRVSKREKIGSNGQTSVSIYDPL